MELLLNDISYIYDEGTSYEHAALAGVNLKISQGEFIGLIGETGAGKSTLIRLMNGLIRPTHGGVFVDGQDIGDKDYPIHKLRGRVGMDFQYPEQQVFESTVIKDVMFGPSNQGLDEFQVELRSYEALKAVGIGQDLLDVSPLELSGGQKRRVAIAGVLAMQPEILILDEPTAGLDAEGREQIFALMHSLHREKGVTIIFISHRMEDVANHASRVIVMHDGRIRMDGTPEEVFVRYKELEDMGLRSTTAVYVAEGLRAKGMQIDKHIVTSDQLVSALKGRSA
ncbi:MAG: energy-coupling factor transporter ATPase [Eubacterium sp.]|nr:energy-coupling factor transporter ATPase [Eubacterium sp.]